MLKDQENSYLFVGNLAYIEEMYSSYLNSPISISDSWRRYFDALQNEIELSDNLDEHEKLPSSSIDRSIFLKRPTIAFADSKSDLNHAYKQLCVQSIINAYRSVGYRLANLDPLKLKKHLIIHELDPCFYGITEEDLDKEFIGEDLYLGFKKAPLREILQGLKNTYCGTIGAEFMHISDLKEKQWWKEKLESMHSKPELSIERKKKILERLIAAEGLERFLHTKYVGQKRFSLEGAESFIVAMDQVICTASREGIQEIVIGMAHRGRLNVLVNTLGKLPRVLFDEFEGRQIDDLPSGDVKYHKGFSSTVSTEYGPIHLSLAFNPSHLEIINPVVEGSARARMDRRGDLKGAQVLPLQVHGDAAFAGQGVVMETLNLSQTRGYSAHGTLHIVINNQIGFTTSDPRDARSTVYCSDVVKMVEAPVLHVNGDDPEAVAIVTELAIEYRNTFHKDVVVDIVCFRKLGHNEQDTPSLTQPLMYKSISKHPGSRAIYAEKLITQKILSLEDIDSCTKFFRDSLEAGKYPIDCILQDYKNKYSIDWSPFLSGKCNDITDTSVPLSEIKTLSECITRIPDNFTVHPLVERVLRDRRAMAVGKQPIDWGMAEHLAFASLLSDGYPIRLTGQDSGRGTFSHRHAVLHDQNRESWDNGIYIPLQHIKNGQPQFTVIDSVLSEEAVLGFEYGYSISAPNTMVLWEAQFGDFVNGAQVVIDQFVSSGEVKWGRLTGLVILLPHGYEGQGPEHSSARIERFLQLCSESNMQVAQPTTPSQMFHLLRRQMIRKFRKPLIIFTPKSLLRRKEAVSNLDEFSVGNFRTIIGEISKNINIKNVTRMIVCSGRVYYDLASYRRDKVLEDIVIIRIEQLYPFPYEEIEREISKYRNIKDVVWVQDEPKNQGPWSYVEQQLIKAIRKDQQLFYVGRPESASPAVGYYSKHCEQQKALIEDAFAPKKCPCV